MAVFCDVAPCSLVGNDRHYRSLLPPLSGFVASLQRRTIPTRLHGTTSQKTAVFNSSPVIAGDFGSASTRKREQGWLSSGL
jgi:hypothetical protein